MACKAQCKNSDTGNNHILAGFPYFKRPLPSSPTDTNGPRTSIRFKLRRAARWNQDFAAESSLTAATSGLKLSSSEEMSLEESGVREGLRRVPRRRRPATRVKGDADEDGNNENSPMLRNSADANETIAQARTGGEATEVPRVGGGGVETDEPGPRRSQRDPTDTAALPRVGEDTAKKDTAKEFLARQKQLERVSAVNMPEIHCIGQVLSCRDVALSQSEGVSCRWKIEFDKAWQHLEGDLVGQTQYSYSRSGLAEETPLNHPLDLHFAESGLHVHWFYSYWHFLRFQGWGAPRISLQCFRMDSYGRRAVAGYGFVHLPLVPGHHLIDIQLWRPAGSPEEELEYFFAGNAPSLIGSEPMYESAWKDRCRLRTATAGTVHLELFVCSRNMRRHGLDY